MDRVHEFYHPVHQAPLKAITIWPGMPYELFFLNLFLALAFMVAMEIWQWIFVAVAIWLGVGFTYGYDQHLLPEFREHLSYQESYPCGDA